MEIRKVEQQDLPQLYRLYCQLVGGDGNYNAMCRAYAEVQNDPHCLLAGVYKGDQLIATASLTRCFDLTGDARFYYSMENFVVDEDHRRMGVGTCLMNYLEDYVRANNGRYINFTSSTAREPAHRFYNKMGYREDYVKGFKKTFPVCTEEAKV